MKKGIILAALLGVALITGSYAYFLSVQKPEGTKEITLLSPNGNDVWTKGSTQTIKWSSKNLENEKIAIYIRRIPPPALKEEGQEFDPIVFTNLENNGSKEWLISDMYPVGNYVLEIVAYPSIPVTTTYSDENNQPFKIVSSL